MSAEEVSGKSWLRDALEKEYKYKADSDSGKQRGHYLTDGYKRPEDDGCGICSRIFNTEIGSLAVEAGSGDQV